MHQLDVIVITYNRTDLLEKTFHSICGQTYNDCVIKLFNNGGTAINADFIKPFQKQYPDKKIEYHSVPVNCQGERGYKNVCSLMQAEYAVLFHDDDLIHPYYLENAMVALKKNPDTVLMTSLALCSSQPDKLPYDRHIKQDEPKYCVGDEKTLAAMYFMGCNLCYPSTIYKTEIYKHNRFDWEPYKKLGDRPSTIYYASFGKTIIFLENYIYYRIHPGQDLTNKQNSLNSQELKNYYSFFKNILYGYDLLYQKIWNYYSKNFVKLTAKANGYKIEEFKTFYKKNIFYPNRFFTKKKNFWTGKFEKLFFPNMTLNDILAVNNEKYVMFLNDNNLINQINTKKNARWKKILSIEKTFNKKGEKRKLLWLLGFRICLKKYQNLLKNINGSNNTVRIKNSFIHGCLKIIIQGDNNIINFENVDFQGSGKIVISGNNHTVEITNEWVGKNLSVFITPPPPFLISPFLPVL